MSYISRLASHVLHLTSCILHLDRYMTATLHAIEEEWERRDSRRDAEQVRLHDELVAA